VAYELMNSIDFFSGETICFESCLILN
jgi:hypothetical protein